MILLFHRLNNLFCHCLLKQIIKLVLIARKLMWRNKKVLSHVYMDTLKQWRVNSTWPERMNYASPPLRLKMSTKKFEGIREESITIYWNSLQRTEISVGQEFISSFDCQILSWEFCSRLLYNYFIRLSMKYIIVDLSLLKTTENKQWYNHLFI